jgi:hypothetical protein
MAPDQKISITVVVSGHPTTLSLNRHQTVAHLVQEALQKSGNVGQPPDQWELRTSDGSLINQALTIADANITDGMTLFLSPKAGAGGH